MQPLMGRGRRDALADLAQSATGAFLALFLCVHLFLVASILLGTETMLVVVKALELNFLSADGHGYPWFVSLIGLGLFAVIALHALLALRKFPQTLRQWRRLTQQLQQQPGREVRLWRWQVVSGFALFLLLPLHLWTMILQSAHIDPWQSAARVWDQHMLWVYLPLLLMAEIHAGIGIYRLILKWVPLKAGQRQRIDRLRSACSLLFIVIGLLSLAALVRVALGESVSILPTSQYGGLAA